MNLNKKRILLVSHDIGGAQLLSSYVYKLGLTAISILATGPSRSAYASLFANDVFVDQQTAETKCRTGEFEILITSTSWESSLELDFISLARSLKIPSISYIDHWVNFRERFNYPEEGWSKNLPDELWAHDTHSFNSAKEYFPQLKISNVGNPYLERQIELSQTDDVIEEKGNILFLTEPISQHLGSSLGYDEFDALDLFFSKIPVLSKGQPYHITIRPHPSERGKYAEKYKIFLSNTCSYSNIENVFQDIKKHEIIVGCDTIALYYAHLLGKKIYSAIPIKIKCSLPVNILYLRDY